MWRKNTVKYLAVMDGDPGLHGIDRVTANVAGIDVGIHCGRQPDSIQVVFGIFSSSFPVYPCTLSSACEKPVVIDRILLLLWETATQSVMLLRALSGLRSREKLNEARLRRGWRAVRPAELQPVGRETALLQAAAGDRVVPE